MDLGLQFGFILERLLELLSVKRSPNCHQKSLRKLALKSRLRGGPSPRKDLQLVRGGGKGGGKRPLLGVEGSGEKKKRRKYEGKKEERK